MAKDEIWTTKDGRKILVSEMSEDHVRDALRLVLRKRRLQARKEARRVFGDASDEIDSQDFLHAEAMRDLANPNAFFPLLDGGVYGSPELAAKHRY